MAKVIIIGSAHPIRGGISTFNHRLAKEFQDMGHDCCIYSFSLQYPSFLFPGTSQFTDEPAPKDIKIKTVINSVNPFNWIAVGKKLSAEKADLVIVRFWIPFMGPALGSILRMLNKKRTPIIGFIDNAIPHEKRIGDKVFTAYFLKACSGFVAMSQKVFDDLKLFNKTGKPAAIVQHPLYDNFGDKLSKGDAKAHLNIEPNDKIILFFGFIRKYKGLDLLLEGFAQFIKTHPSSNYKLLIAGEFYEDEANYMNQIHSLDLEKHLILKTTFIPDSEVKYYLSAAEVLVQPYKNATQSGVTPLAYYFEVPMIVTNVGGLPDLVPNRKSGMVVESNAADIAKGLDEFCALGADYFIPFLKEEKKKFSWENIVNATLEMAKNLRK